MAGCLFSFAAPDLISPRPSLPIVLQSTFISLHENCKRYPSKLEEMSPSSCRRSVRSSQYRISSVLWSVAAKKISHLRIGVCFDSFFLSASDISNYCYRSSATPVNPTGSPSLPAPLSPTGARIRCSARPPKQFQRDFVIAASSKSSMPPNSKSAAVKHATALASSGSVGSPKIKQR